MADEQPFVGGQSVTFNLADLKAQHQRLGALIAAIENFMSAGGAPAAGVGDASPQAGGDPLAANQDRPITPGMFLSLSIGEAARQLLLMRKRKLGTADIAKALQDGGVVFSGQSPVNVVSSVLHREAQKANADIVTVGRGVWGIASWFSNPQRFKKARKLVDMSGVEPSKGEDDGDGESEVELDSVDGGPARPPVRVRIRKRLPDA